MDVGEQGRRNRIVIVTRDQVVASLAILCYHMRVGLGSRLLGFMGNMGFHAAEANVMIRCLTHGIEATSWASGMLSSCRS